MLFRSGERKEAEKARARAVENVKAIDPKEHAMDRVKLLASLAYEYFVEEKYEEANSLYDSAQQLRDSDLFGNIFISYGKAALIARDKNGKPTWTGQFTKQQRKAALAAIADYNEHRTKKKYE